MRQCKRKGFIQIQFAWIFIIIAGSIILFFFISLVKTQGEVSANKLSQRVLTNLDAIMTGSKVSTNTCHLIEIPRLDIELDCRALRMSGNSRELADQMVFGPDKIKGSSLLTCAKDWNSPYRVANFLYLTTTEVRYIVVYDDSAGVDLAEKLYDNMPENLNKDLVTYTDFASLEDKNNYKVRLITFDNEYVGYIPEFMKRYDSYIVNIIPTTVTGESLFGYGEVEFFDVDDDGNAVTNGTAAYLRDASLFAAIFAEDQSQYLCVMKKAMTRLKFISQIYIDRTKDLYAYYEGDPTCSNHYEETGTEDIIRNIQIAADAVFIDGKFTEGESGDLNFFSISLKSQNELAQLYSCPVLY